MVSPPLMLDFPAIHSYHLFVGKSIFLTVEEAP